MRSHFAPLCLVPWTHAITLTFSRNAANDLRFGGKLAEPNDLIYKHFVRPVAIGLKLRVAAASVFVGEAEGIRPHAHLLMLGQNAKGQTLRDFTVLQIGKHWRFGEAFIQRVDDVEGAVRYLEQNARQSVDTFTLHGHDLLNRWMNTMTTSSPQRRVTEQETSPPWA